MNFFLCYAFNCAFGILVIQLTIHRLLYHSIDYAKNTHPSIQFNWFMYHAGHYQITGKTFADLNWLFWKYVRVTCTTGVELSVYFFFNSRKFRLIVNITAQWLCRLSKASSQKQFNFQWKSFRNFKISKIDIFDATSGSFISSSFWNFTISFHGSWF